MEEITNLKIQWKYLVNNTLITLPKHLTLSIQNLFGLIKEKELINAKVHLINKWNNILLFNRYKQAEETINDTIKHEIFAA